MEFLNVADLRDPTDPAGRSYRQVNADKTHKIPIGSLVELPTGARMFVVYQGRDCDMTPLYWLSAKRDDTEHDRPGFANRGWYGGVDEESLCVVPEVEATEKAK